MADRPAIPHDPPIENWPERQDQAYRWRLRELAEAGKLPSRGRRITRFGPGRINANEHKHYKGNVS